MSALTDHAERAQLAGNVIRFIESTSSSSAEDFNDLALRIYNYQVRENSFYRAYCNARGNVQPSRWQQIPPVPTTAFKRTAIRSFPEQVNQTYFQTSGTTEGDSGRHYFETLEIYKAAILPNFKAHLLPDVERMQMMILTASPAQSPHSSLVHMMEVVRHEFGTPGAGYYVQDDRLDITGLSRAMEQAIALNAPVFLLGTAIAFLQFLDSLTERGSVYELPPGSRIMETGGFKGRSREVSRAELYAMMQQRLNVPLESIVNEYSMTELSSQFYDTSLRDHRATDWKSIPPWTRILIVDPLSGTPVPDGAQGLIHIFDLANTGSILAIATEDVGIRQGDQFRILGRVPHAQPRGCSLAWNSN